jgi:hypothetical protein
MKKTCCFLVVIALLISCTVKFLPYRVFVALPRRLVLGTLFALFDDRMEYYCQHCKAFKTGSAYRVTIESDGIMLLNLTVCYECYVDARRLGLHTEPISPRDTVRERYTVGERYQVHAA